MNHETANTHGRWLSPSAALTRFDPPAGAAIGVRPSVAGQRTRFGFRVGQLRLLIKPDTLSEVVTQMPISPIPNVPAWFLGVINLRGNLLPVFDLHQLLETGESGRDKRAVLILDQGSDMVGMPIDGLPQSVTTDRALRTVPPLPEVLQEHVPVAYIMDDATWMEFDYQSFFIARGRQVAS